MRAGRAFVVMEFGGAVYAVRGTARSLQVTRELIEYAEYGRFPSFHHTGNIDVLADVAARAEDLVVVAGTLDDLWEATGGTGTRAVWPVAEIAPGVGELPE